MNLSTRHADQERRRWGSDRQTPPAGHFDEGCSLDDDFAFEVDRSSAESRHASQVLCFENEVNDPSSVRVEPELRAAAESVLHEGESLTGFIEATMRRAVEYRRVQAEFHARGQAAWEEIQRGGITHPAEDVLARLREMTAARRDKLQTR